MQSVVEMQRTLCIW